MTIYRSTLLHWVFTMAGHQSSDQSDFFWANPVKQTQSSTNINIKLLYHFIPLKWSLEQVVTSGPYRKSIHSFKVEEEPWSVLPHLSGDGESVSVMGRLVEPNSCPESQKLLTRNELQFVMSLSRMGSIKYRQTVWLELESGHFYLKCFRWWCLLKLTYTLSLDVMLAISSGRSYWFTTTIKILSWIT